MKKNKEISAALWKKIKAVLPVREASNKGGRPRLDDEQALNGILLVLLTGIAWEDLPKSLALAAG